MNKLQEFSSTEKSRKKREEKKDIHFLVEKKDIHFLVDKFMGLRFFSHAPGMARVHIFIYVFMPGTHMLPEILEEWVTCWCFFW